MSIKTNKLTRLERMAFVFEDTLEKLISNADKGKKNPYIYRYNFWSHRIDEELKKNLNVDTAHLKVSKFMEQLISHWIVREQRLKDIYELYSDFRTDSRFNHKYRKEKIKELYSL